jgi:hypothetical protein
VESRRPEEDLEGKVKAMSDDELRRAMAKKGKAAEEDRLMEASLRGPLRNSAPHGEWLALMKMVKGWARSTFNLKLAEFKRRHPELIGGRWQSDPYSLSTQPTAAMMELVASLSLNWPDLTPLRKAKVQSSPRQSDELTRLKRQLAGVV